MSNIKSKHGRNVRASARNCEIDLALAIMCALLRPGESVPYHVIAEVTGMSHGGPYAIEQRALRKLRIKVTYATDKQWGAEVRA